MRTKTLLLTAALSAAGVAASMAQVYSVNVVGYVNYTVPAGKWACLGNPLMNGTNGINQVLSMPATADGVLVYRFDSVTQGWRDAIQYVDGFGWYSPTDDGTVLAPGEGFFFQNNRTVPLTITFVGEVMQSSQYTLSTPIAGNGKWTLVGSQVPQQARLGDTNLNASGTLQFPAADGDLVYTWNGNSYSDAYGYVAGYGWYTDSDPTPAGPVIDVGTGFWIQKNPSAPAANWNRTWNVQ